jgi:hypothetical protein
MSNTGKKTTFNHKLVKITWWDIKSSEKSWIAEDEIMKEDIAICYDVGWIWKETKDKLWLFTSYSFDECGNGCRRSDYLSYGCNKKNRGYKMTDVDMFANYKGKIKILKEKIKVIHKGSYDLEQIIERQNREINTLKQIIDLQAKKIEQDRVKNVPKC